jgi:hypothetical protein
MPGGAFSIHDNWGTQKATAASGGHEHADDCGALLNVVVSDLASFRFLHIKFPCRPDSAARLNFLRGSPANPPGGPHTNPSS